ncbi:MAG: hypothetical protein KC910_20100 [Candidatus Eremiobacteraeota bacterium]|nr:hypothetical protein [Candidatus Eremiobacteraeota bacterium]
MSEDKIKRRRFLADVLFAGGGLTAAAFLAKAGLDRQQPDPTVAGDIAPPQPANTPVDSPTCSDPDIEGDVAQPMPDQTPCEKPPELVSPKDEPNVAGGLKAPQPEALPGRVAVPIKTDE